jgi:hypothetical protein
MKKIVKISTIIRWILSILLLWQIWTHSHWSVALSLTLLFIYCELVIILTKIATKK